MIISNFVVLFIFVAVVAAVGAVEHVLGVANAFLSRLQKKQEWLTTFLQMYATDPLLVKPNTFYGGLIYNISPNFLLIS